MSGSLGEQALPWLAHGREGVIISINETCSGDSGLSGHGPGAELGHPAPPLGQAVAVYRRLPRLRRRVREDWMPIELRIRSAECGVDYPKSELQS